MLILCLSIDLSIGTLKTKFAIIIIIILCANPYIPYDFECCLSSRLGTHQLRDPVGADLSKHRYSDEPVTQAEVASMMKTYSEPLHRARLLAANSEHSGDWLHDLPNAACDLRLDDNANRVAVGLRLGSSLCTVLQAQQWTLAAPRVYRLARAESSRHSSDEFRNHTV